MGKVKKGVKCSVVGCDKEAVKTISARQFAEANLDLNVQETAGKVYLCKDHYKYYKKKTKKMRMFDKWKRWRI